MFVCLCFVYEKSAWILYSLELVRSSGKNCTHSVQNQMCFEMTLCATLLALFFLSVVNPLLQEFFPVKCNTKLVLGNFLTVQMNYFDNNF